MDLVSQAKNKKPQEDQRKDIKSLSHTKRVCQYHIVWIPKYRQKRLYGEVKADVREILKTLCGYKRIEIVEGAVCIDHMHICVSIPPKMKLSDVVGYLKGKSALMLYDRRPEQRSKWDKGFWATGYYVTTVGNITEEAIKRYIHEQSEEDRKRDRSGAAF